jgi:uncharacterized protein YbjT (DUF2867 family)
MIVVTTPTGQIGGQTAVALLNRGEPVRVVVRDAGRLDPALRERVEVVEGSHADAAVLGRALEGADALFWLIPPGGSGDARARYLDFVAPLPEALRGNGVPRVVAVSSAGHDRPEGAGVLSAAFAMDAAIEASGVAYRALGLPWFMENLIRQAEAIGAGTLALPYDPDRVLAAVATRDVAATAAGLLADRTWEGQEVVPVFSPDALTPVAMAAVLAEVLDREVTYARVGLDEMAAGMIGQGIDEAVVRDLSGAIVAVNAGIYDADQAAADPAPTDFRTWCAEVLRPLVVG